MQNSTNSEKLIDTPVKTQVKTPVKTATKTPMKNGPKKWKTIQKPKKRKNTKKKENEMYHQNKANDSYNFNQIDLDDGSIIVLTEEEMSDINPDKTVKPWENQTWHSFRDIELPKPTPNPNQAEIDEEYQEYLKCFPSWMHPQEN